MDEQALTRGAGDRGCAGVGLQRAGVGETGAVIAELGQHPGAGEIGKAREAGDDGRVRVLVEGLAGGFGEIVSGTACRIQLQ
ncbi:MULTISPECIES: hypothetical protein [unclassified Nonomuraea]|uniref:hypothetical protein n=1 Tax=unclassified Nonomuraea TaxID=2593643 RepID=UPI0033D12881